MTSLGSWLVRWTSLLAASLISLASAAGVPAQSSPATGAPTHRPTLAFADSASQATLGRAYRLALHNLLDINTVPYDPAVYDSAGLMVDDPETFIRAGGGYDQPWTRDASVNTWNAASLLEPLAAGNTLWSVVRRGRDGTLAVQQDNQWWDQCVWVASAWNHFLVTGDTVFLARAYRTARNTLELRRDRSYDARYGLFRGPGFFNDGIAGYPVPPATNPETSSFVLDYAGTSTQMTLSTNALYVEAFHRAARMARALGRPRPESAELSAFADSLAASINRHFWMPSAGRYGYFIHGDGAAAGTLDTSQEGTGEAFAILFGVADSTRARDVLAHVHEEPWGIPDVWPHFPRYDDAHPGRHNVIVWPMVMGFWADAAAAVGDEATFARQVRHLAALAEDADKGAGSFREIYNARTGAPDGGWQTGHHWDAQPDQTWSATAYLRMIDDGLFGMRFTPDGLAFRPLLPAGWGSVTLTGVPYRDMTLDITLRGEGHTVTEFSVDGVLVPSHSVSASLHGAHTVMITLGGR